MTDRVITTPRSLARDGGRPMSALLDALIVRNPLLGHGPRTHATGIAVTTDISTAAPARRTPRRRLDVDAPKVHLGHAGRAA